MNDPLQEVLSVGAVRELSRLLGIEPGNEAMAERIAAGSGAAAAAVRAVLEHGANGRLFDRESADYLPLLESLASRMPPVGVTAPRARTALLRGAVPTDLGMLDADIVSMREQLATRRWRSVDLVRAALERAEAARVRTNCFLHIDRVAALRRAEMADLMLDEAFRQGRAAPFSLLGVPFAHKDMFARAGEVHSFGSRVPDSRVATQDATVMQRLDAAGAVTIGALNMAEFALGPTGHNGAFGDCRNAWNTDYIAGGSSSGSGVAVACGAVAGSLGSDTGGSVRIPAAVNGVFGLKPTYGLIPRSGAMKLSPSIDVIGPFTRSTRDLALLLGVLAGGDGRDAQCSMQPVPDYRIAATRGIEGLRVGLPREYFLDDLDPSVRSALERSLAIFEAAGARLVEVPVPDVRAMAELSRAVVYAEATALHASWLRSRGESYTPQVRLRALTGLGIPAPLYLEALQLRLPLLERFVAEVFSRCEILVTPTLPLRTPSREETDVGAGPELWRTLSRLVRCTAPFNYLGLPVLSMPAGFDVRGLPLATQIVAPPFGESRLLQFAAVHEIHHLVRSSAANWPRK